mmetsp:Transcript_5714/g.10169  ORF Transcript_5714/g.10169 Transcript_5714/m.10169 type:complete len:99 (-) Transcript_5714:51-347(-)
MWIHSVLDNEPHDLHGTAEVQAVLRPLMASLSLELGDASRAGQVFGCVVKWRMALGLAKSRKAAPSVEEEDGDEEVQEGEEDNNEEAAHDQESSDADE